MNNKNARGALALTLGLLVSTLGTSGLTSCTSKNQNESNVVEQSYESAEELDTKVFEPYTHVYFKRYDLLKHDMFSNKIFSKDVISGQIEIPEGYEILEIENFDELINRGSQTRGFDVWFINNTTVEVNPTYNSFYEKYDYSEPGRVIQLEDSEVKVKEK